VSDFRRPECHGLLGRGPRRSLGRGQRAQW